MSANGLILLAMLAQGALAMVLLVWLGRKRLPLIGARKIRIADIALSSDPWPEAAQQASNAFDNQFQLPVLFYVACAITLYMGVGWLDVILAFGFVASRIVHAFIHVTSNHVIRRFTAYVTGLGVLVIWWLVLIVHVILGKF